MAVSEPTYNDMIVDALTRYPDREAFVDGDRRVTYAQSADCVGRIVSMLAVRGVGAGSSVLALSPNRPESWFVQAATYLLGARFTGLQAMGSVEDHVYVCGDAGASVLFVDPMFAETASELEERAPTLQHVITFGPADIGEDLFTLYAATSPAPLAVGDRGLEDVAWIQYTGGTTGHPKGAMLPQRALVAQTLSLLASWDIPVRPRYLAAGPITHVSVLPVLPTLMRGGTVILHRGFDPGRWLRAVEEERANYAFAVPTMIYTLLDKATPENHDLTSLQTVTYGASPMSARRMEEAQTRIGPVFEQMYGQTETTGMGTTLRKDEHDAHNLPHLLTSCGRPMVGVHLETLDDQDRPVARGEVGEIAIRSRSAMAGYLNLRAQTASTLRNGWVRTGDMGRRDDEGFVYVVDRAKDMIISGGVNVYAGEVEIALADESVAQIAVIGVPDDKWGEAVKAFVVPVPGATVDPAALIAGVKERKGSHQAPKSIEIVDSLPVTPVGKIDKKALRAPYWSDDQRAVH